MGIMEFILFMKFSDFVTTKCSIIDQILNVNVKCREAETTRGFPRAEYSKFHQFPENQK